MLTVTVCVGSSCHLNGSYRVIEEFQRLIKEEGLENRVNLKAGFCLGSCTRAVTVKIGDEIVGPVSVESLSDLIANIKNGEFMEGKTR